MTQEKTFLFHYTKETKEFKGQSEARLDPLDKKPLIPAHATMVAVPSLQALQENETYIFNEETNSWDIVSDYRGKTFFKPDGTSVKVTALGQEPDAEWSNERPPLTEEQIIQGVKIEAARRITSSGHDWMALRQITTGEAVPTSVVEYAQAVRTASNELETTLPQDYTNDQYWPVL